MHKLLDILNNTKKIYQSDNSLRLLCDVERVLDSFNIYSFRNWELGELASGPVSKRYWVECEFLWPYKLMPDPRGAKRLVRNDILVEYKKSALVHSKPIESADDFEPGTKMPKMTKKPIWIVKLSVPRHLLSDILTGSIDIGDKRLDFTELDHAYDADLDTASVKEQGEENTQDQEMGGLPADMSGMGMPPQGMPNV
jgi:hypothetical protein